MDGSCFEEGAGEVHAHLSKLGKCGDLTWQGALGTSREGVSHMQVIRLKIGFSSWQVDPDFCRGLGAVPERTAGQEA